MRYRPSRFQGFLLISGALLVAAVAVAGLLVARVFERHVLGHEETQTIAMVQNQALQHLTPREFEGALDAEQERTFQWFLQGLPGVFRIKVFDRTGRILWSNERRLIGMAFPDNAYVAAALQGRPSTVMERPSRPEHLFERDRQYVAEAYVPIVLPGRPDPVGVIETYKDMTGLRLDVERTQALIWGVAGALGLGLYVALAAIVWAASVSERRAIGRLEAQNQELTLLHLFTQSVIKPHDLAGAARSLVEGAGAGLRLARAALYRVEAGRAVGPLAEWPDETGAAPSPDLVAEAARRGGPVLRDATVAVPMATHRGAGYLFAGEFRRPPGRHETAALRTLEIMLHEGAMVLANVELFTEIREAHERLSAIVAGIADRMVIVDRAMRVVWMNAAAAAGSGGQGIGRSCFELMGVGVESCEGCPAIRTFQSGQVERGVRVLRGADGTTRYLDLVAAPLRDASGAVHQVLEVARDITELVEMEERLKRTNQALLDTQTQLVEQERLAAVGQLVVGLHHAILNPLTGVLGALRVLREGSLSAAEAAQAVAEAENEIRKVERLVKRLPVLQRAQGTPYVGHTTMLDLGDGGQEPPAGPGTAPREAAEPPRGSSPAGGE